MNHRLLPVALGAILCTLPPMVAEAGNFRYHGTLQDAGKPAEGRYDIELTLYSAATGGSVVAGPLTLYGVEARAGRFHAEADLGPLPKAAAQAWVAARVANAGSGDFVALDGRTPADVGPAGTCSAWALDGNSGNPDGSYLGTADDQPLQFMVNGQRAGIIYPASQPNLVFGRSTNGVGAGVVNATISGGTGNTVSGAGGTVAGGAGNTAGGINSFAAGWNNTANGFAASAPGGESNAAGGRSSFAAGFHASAAHDGTFVWSDFSSANAFASTGAHQFLIRASGGVGIGTNNPGNFDLRVEGAKGSSFINGNESTTVNVANLGNGPALYLLAGGSNTIETPSGARLTTAGQWVNASDRNLKDGFAAIDASGVLAKVVAMPVTSWFYKREGESVRHIGPVAQDFHAAFGLGSGDTTIGTVDESGVALAAIQGLHRKVEDENAALQAENASLSARVEQLAARILSLEAARGE